jgi:hypothetical protein
LIKEKEMTAIELADWFEITKATPNGLKAAAMLRKQDAAIKQLREALVDCKYGLEGARIWGGMEWTYNPLHPYKYLQLRDKAEAALEATEEFK